MPCSYIDYGDGNFAHVRFGSRRRKRCRFCNTGFADKLCDYPMNPRGKTCDAAMCSKCATAIGIDTDFCPTHAKGAPPAQQGDLAL